MSLIECEIDAINLYGEFGGVLSISCILSMALVTVFVAVLVVISFCAAILNPDLFAKNLCISRAEERERETEIKADTKWMDVQMYIYVNAMREMEIK